MTTQAASRSIGSRVLGRERRNQIYRVRMAESIADVRAAQALRFLVFNVELNEGLDESYSTCLDADLFDGVCDHLLVEEVETKEIVGTYRLQTGLSADTHLGYYSGQEFDMAPFESIRTELVELGRACVHSQHRNATVLGLLWKGIARYARERDSRYLIGCSSLPTQEVRVGASVYRELREGYLAREQSRTWPWPVVACPLPEPRSDDPAVRVPKLLAAYLSLGARICGPPAIDRRFRTIDFLTMIDLQDLPPGAMAGYLI